MADSLAPSVPLLEIVDRIHAAIGEIDAQTGEVSPDTLAKLDALDVSLGDKTNAYHIVDVQLKCDAESCRELAKQLTERAKARDRARERLKDRLLLALDSLGQESIKTPTVTVYLQPAASVEITGDVPDEYCTVKVERVPDKRAIKAALERGEKLPFAQLQINRSVRYR